MYKLHSTCSCIRTCGHCLSELYNTINSNKKEFKQTQDELCRTGNSKFGIFQYASTVYMHVHDCTSTRKTRSVAGSLFYFMYMYSVYSMACLFVLLVACHMTFSTILYNVLKVNT